MKPVAYTRTSIRKPSLWLQFIKYTLLYFKKIQIMKEKKELLELLYTDA